MATDAELSHEPKPPGLARRLAAIAYDCFLLAAVMFAATAALLPFTGGEAVPAGNGLYPVYLVAVCFCYFGWFWTHGGQTLGMRSWNLRLAGDGRRGATWRQALLRFAGACLSWAALGLGFFWILVDPDGQSWHDRLSGTHIADVPRRPADGARR